VKYTFTIDKVYILKNAVCRERYIFEREVGDESNCEEIHIYKGTA